MHPCNSNSGLCSPTETLNTLFLQSDFILQPLCGCAQMFAYLCLCMTVCVRIWCLFVWLSVEVETAFGFGALLQREKKKKLKKKKKSPQVTDGNFSGPTMLQSISLHWNFLLLCLIAQLSLPQQ